MLILHKIYRWPINSTDFQILRKDTRSTTEYHLWRDLGCMIFNLFGSEKKSRISNIAVANNFFLFPIILSIFKILVTITNLDYYSQQNFITSETFGIQTTVSFFTNQIRILNQQPYFFNHTSCFETIHLFSMCI